MRRRTQAMACLGAALVAATLAAGPARAAAAHEAVVSLLACHRATDPAARYMTVEGVMHALSADERLRMRFDLYRRSQVGGSAVRLPGPGLGIFNRAQPGVGNYRFRKTIRNLSTAGEYRVTVTFRWLSSEGAVVASAVRGAPACRQVDARPDLRIAAVEVSAAPDPAEAIYTVTVRNAGASRAVHFRVGLSIGGRGQQQAQVDRLGAAQRTAVTFKGPRCPPGAPVVAVVDPEHGVTEVSDANNVRGLTCPTAGTAAPRLATTTLIPR